MEAFFAISEILSELGFSFWQLVVLVLAFGFREDLKILVRRVSKFKLAGNEIELERESNSISDLLDIRTEIRDKNLKSEQVVIEIEEKIHRRAIGAMINLKKNTSFLWEQGFVKNPSKATAQIRRNTLQRVLSDLELLEELDLVSTERKRLYKSFDEDEVLEMEVTITSPKTVLLVEEANKF